MPSMQGSGHPELIIQRYSTPLWPHIRGERPFILRGPNWRHLRELRRVLKEFEFLPGDDRREIAAELILRGGLATAYWAVGSTLCAPVEDRWALSIRQCADEIPKVGPEWPIDLGAWELLDGMSTIEHYHIHFQRDVLELEALEIPSDI